MERIVAFSYAWILLWKDINKQQQDGFKLFFHTRYCEIFQHFPLVFAIKPKSMVIVVTWLECNRCSIMLDEKHGFLVLSNCKFFSFLLWSFGKTCLTIICEMFCVKFFFLNKVFLTMWAVSMSLSKQFLIFVCPQLLYSSWLHIRIWADLNECWL